MKLSAPHALFFVGTLLQLSQAQAYDKAVNRFFLLGFEVATCMIGVVKGRDEAQIASESSKNIKSYLAEVRAPKEIYSLLDRYLESIDSQNRAELDSHMILLINNIADHGKREYGNSGYHASLFGMWAGMVTVSIALGENPYEIVKSGRDFLPWLENDRRFKSRKILANLLDYRHTDINQPDFAQNYMRALYTLVQSFSL
ncbi:MAG: hypothetical protein JXA30_03405 [Deltaproteobacteria bacterium]|nr:hypothetical protein [Deltaproteobacteria bacterium]